MNNLQIFSNEEYGQVRTVIHNGKPYFVASDIARALGYSIPSKAVQTHCKGVSRMEVPTDGGKQEMLIIPEGDVFRLISKSQLPFAEKFETWVFDEVLPSINRTGGYVSNDDLFINTYLPFADQQTQELFKSTLTVIRKQNEQIQAMQPKVDYFNELVDRNLLMNFRDTAKELHIKEKDFISFLISKKYIYRNGGKLYPYAERNNGLFEIKEFVNERWTGNQTLITPKGRETFRLLIKGICG